MLRTDESMTELESRMAPWIWEQITWFNYALVVGCGRVVGSDRNHTYIANTDAGFELPRSSRFEIGDSVVFGGLWEWAFLRDRRSGRLFPKEQYRFGDKFDDDPRSAPDVWRSGRMVWECDKPSPHWPSDFETIRLVPHDVFYHLEEMGGPTTECIAAAPRTKDGPARLWPAGMLRLRFLSHDYQLRPRAVSWLSSYVDEAMSFVQTRDWRTFLGPDDKLFNLSSGDDFADTVRATRVSSHRCVFKERVP